MGVNKEDIEQSNKDFGEGFNAEEVKAPDQTDDEAFGLTVPAPSSDAEAVTETEPVTESAISVVAPEAAAPAPGEEAGIPEEVVPPAGGEAEGEPSQAEKSWEGRLRKREEELKAKAAELEAREKALGGESPAEELAEGETEQPATDGNIDPDEAIRQLSEDFGPEFVNMIMAIAGKKAEEIAAGRVDEIGKTLGDVIADIKDSRARRHFKEIYKAHPDFVEVSESEGFKTWIESMDAAKKPEAERIVASGDADDINALLSEYKATNKAGDNTPAADPITDDGSIDDAEGVRSSGLRLPDEPAAGKDDYASAWDGA